MHRPLHPAEAASICHLGPATVFALPVHPELIQHRKRMKLQIPTGDFRAYLFDCDGTIADSMPLHYIAWKSALGEWNCDFDEQLFYQWGGKPPMEIVAGLNRMQGLSMPVEAVATRKEKLYFELLPQLEPVAEVLEHIEAMHRRIPFAVVSGSTHESVVNSLTAIGLLDKFDLIVGSEEYARSKPAPDAYLTAAQRLGVPPARCLVFEDAEIGIQAATAAGMVSVRVPSPLERRKGTNLQHNP
jgi:HAD superfamily hydrolase (TIGR01509 family)